MAWGGGTESSEAWGGLGARFANATNVCEMRRSNVGESDSLFHCNILMRREMVMVMMMMMRTNDSLFHCYPYPSADCLNRRRMSMGWGGG